MSVTLKKNKQLNWEWTTISNQPVTAESSFKKEKAVINEGKDVVCILYFRGQILYSWC